MDLNERLTESDSQRISDSLFMTLYGVKLFKKMRKLKRIKEFVTEAQFVAWIVEELLPDTNDSDKESPNESADEDEDNDVDGNVAYLSLPEVQNVADVVLMTLFGTEVYARLQGIRNQLGMVNEAQTLTWMLDQFDANAVLSQSSSADASISDNVNKPTDIFYEEVVSKVEDGEEKEKNTKSAGPTNLIPIRIILNTSQSSSSTQDGQDTGNFTHYTVLSGNSSTQQGIVETANTNTAANVVHYQLDGTGEMVEVIPSSAFEPSATDRFADEQRYFTTMRKRRSNRRGRLPLASQGQYPQLEDEVTTATGRPVKRFGCELCSYVTRRRGDLGKHYRTHTGEKPFTCSWCGKSFNVSSNLNSHIMAIHQELKTYVCRFCDYQTSVKQSFRRHLVRRHGYEANYRCGECGKYFYSTQLLKAHLKRHDDQVRKGGIPSHSMPSPGEVSDDDHKVHL